jgi:predicted secreted protein with PEFG-CTERM motif
MEQNAKKINSNINKAGQVFVKGMNYKAYTLIVILSVSIALIGANAALIRAAFSQTNLVTVKTDKAEYQKGNLIIISGKVETLRAGAEEPLLVQVFNPAGAAYRADLVNIAANGSYNDKLNIGGQLGISGQYRVVVTYDKANEQSLFHFVSTTAPHNGNNTYNLNIGGKAYPLAYQITGAGNKLNSITAQLDNTTLLLNTVAQSNGKLTIELPRNVIDSKKQGNTDEPYAVWEDGQPQSADEINTKNNSQVRTLAIDFDKGNGQIEIAGNKIVPVTTTQDAASGNSNSSITAAHAVGLNNTINLKFDGKAYPLAYQITGAGNKLSNVSAQRDNTTLLLNTVAQSNGKLTIELPRNVIDSKKQGNTDEPYAVWEDGQPQSADEINTKNNSQVRTLAIDFDKGNGQIEIAGTKMTPEFGTIAIIIPAIAIIGIIIAGVKYKQFSFRPRQ